MRRSVSLGLLVALSITALLSVACSPIGPIPGGRLGGEVHTGPLPSWQTVAAVEQIQLETRPSDPYSVNIWFGVHDGRLYIPTSLILGVDEPSERTWVQNVVADPDVRIRIDEILYELRATRVTDSKELEAARQVMVAKYEVEEDDHSSRAWVFRLESR